MFGTKSWLNIALHCYGQGVIADLTRGAAEDGRQFLLLFSCLVWIFHYRPPGLVRLVHVLFFVCFVSFTKKKKILSVPLLFAQRVTFIASKAWKASPKYTQTNTHTTTTITITTLHNELQLCQRPRLRQAGAQTHFIVNLLLYGWFITRELPLSRPSLTRRARRPLLLRTRGWVAPLVRLSNRLQRKVTEPLAGDGFHRGALLPPK